MTGGYHLVKIFSVLIYFVYHNQNYQIFDHLEIHHISFHKKVYQKHSHIEHEDKVRKNIFDSLVGIGYILKFVPIIL